MRSLTLREEIKVLQDKTFVFQNGDFFLFSGYKHISRVKTQRKKLRLPNYHKHVGIPFSQNFFKSQLEFFTGMASKGGFPTQKARVAPPTLI